jgi:hypothetical protein
MRCGSSVEEWTQDSPHSRQVSRDSAFISNTSPSQCHMHVERVQDASYREITSSAMNLCMRVIRYSKIDEHYNIMAVCLFFCAKLFSLVVHAG